MAKDSIMRILASLILILAIELIASSARAAQIKVPITFIEALSPKDTTSSERFQKEYETAVAIGKKQSAEQLAKCGYEISEKFVFYDASDSIQALEQAKKSAAEASWFLVGPRRSNHYLLLAKGAPDTASVSLMASASETGDLGDLHLSMSPLNGQMASVAAVKVKELAKNSASNYFSIVSEDCVSCIDFASQFDASAKKVGVKKIGEARIVGEAPNLADAKQLIMKFSPRFVLVPNYSKVTASIIREVFPIVPNAIFVGGDGWGDSKFGFVQNNDSLEAAKGITVRGFPPTKIGLEKFDLGIRALKDANSSDLASGSSLALIRIFGGLEKLLCLATPKNGDDFQRIFRSLGRKYFSAPWGVSIYTLKDGNILFDETRK